MPKSKKTEDPSADVNESENVTENQRSEDILNNAETAVGDSADVAKEADGTVENVAEEAETAAQDAKDAVKDAAEIAEDSAADVSELTEADDTELAEGTSYSSSESFPEDPDEPVNEEYMDEPSVDAVQNDARAEDVSDEDVQEDTIEDAVIVEDEAETAGETTDAETAQPAPATEPVAAVHTPENRSTFWPMLFGGAIAAAIGFFVASAGLLDKFMPEDDAPVDHTATIEALQTDLSAVQTALADLNARIDGLPVAETVDLAPLETAVSDLGARIEAVEARPEPSAIADVPDLSGALDEFSKAFAELQQKSVDLQSKSDEQQAEIARLIQEASEAEANAAAEAQATLARAALAQMQSAFDAGQPFKEPLATLGEIGIADVPQILKDTAEEGVATIASLQTELPDAARAALSAARQDTAQEGGIGGFLTRQLGVRSLEPREGDDPDAVLSRLEAAVRSNRLNDALAEASSLSDAAKDALGDWLVRAETRDAAVSAVNTLIASLSTN